MPPKLAPPPVAPAAQAAQMLRALSDKWISSASDKPECTLQSDNQKRGLIGPKIRQTKLSVFVGCLGF